MPNSFSPLPTQYSGTLFRSRLEARWAICFDALDQPWRYEVEGYQLNGTHYLPDFYLPRLNAWVEAKGRQPTHGEFVKATALSQAHPEALVVLTWEYFSRETARDNVAFWHDEAGVFHSRRGWAWLPMPEAGWQAALSARFDRGLFRDWQPRVEVRRLPY